MSKRLIVQSFLIIFKSLEIIIYVLMHMVKDNIDYTNLHNFKRKVEKMAHTWESQL